MSGKLKLKWFLFGAAFMGLLFNIIDRLGMKLARKRKRKREPVAHHGQLVLRSNQMIQPIRLRPKRSAVSRGEAVNHVFDSEH